MGPKREWTRRGPTRPNPLIVAATILLLNAALFSALAVLFEDAAPESVPAERRPAANLEDSSGSRNDLGATRSVAAAARQTSESAIDPAHPLLPLLSLAPFARLSDARLLRLDDPTLSTPVLLRVRYGGLDAAAARDFATSASADSVRLILALFGVALCGPISDGDRSWIRSIVLPDGLGWHDGRPARGALAAIHALRWAGEFGDLEAVGVAWLERADPEGALDESLGLLLEAVAIPSNRLPVARLLFEANSRPRSSRVRAACFRLLARSGDVGAIRALFTAAESGDPSALAGIAALDDPRPLAPLRAWVDDRTAGPRAIAALRALLRGGDREDFVYVEARLVGSVGSVAASPVVREAWTVALDGGEPDPTLLPSIFRLRARAGDSWLASFSDRSTSVVPASLPPRDRARLRSGLRRVVDEFPAGSTTWVRAIATLARFATVDDREFLAARRDLAADPELRFRIDLALGRAIERDYRQYLTGSR